MTRPACDEKLVCVPHSQVHPLHGEIETMTDLPQIARQSIEHFFGTYNVEPGKSVKIKGWGSPDVA